MKKTLFILFVLGTLPTLFAQDATKRADRYFERTFYSEAIPLYEQLLPRHKSPGLIRNLAESHYRTYDMKAAASWYSHLATHYAASMDESLYFKWNQSLKALGDHDRANQVLLDYYAQHYGAERVDQFRAEMSYLENVRAIGERFEIENLPLNGPNSEFGALRVDSTLFYSAARKNPGKLYRWNNQKYLDIYAHPYDGMDLGDSLSVGVSKSINTKKRHEGTFAITQDGKTLYFTRNARKKTKPDKIKNLKIFRAEKIDGKWKNIQELPFNGKGFSTEHPALSPDGGKLYFASDREGGFGSFDIYWVTIQSDGTYGPVMNLGKEINTDKKEQFPFLDGDGNLYFSSNGHPGFGLLDVFVAKNSSGVFEGPDNMGLPMNSGHDDFSVSIDPGGGTGYFSSNRPGGKGSDDIYSFVQIKPLIIEACSQYIAGTLRDRTTDLPLAHAGIQLFDAQGNMVQSLTTDDKAEFRFMVQCGTQYRIEARKQGYGDNQKVVRTDMQRKAVHDGSLDLFSDLEREKREALVLREKQEEAEREAKAQVEQRVREEKLAEQKRVQLEKVTAQRKAIAQEKNVRERQMEIERAIENEPLIVRENGRTIINIPEIHFDYSLWYLRREARERLGQVVELLNDHPGIVLEIGTHTDVRGNAEYNRDLSQKRADVAKAFLVKSGITGNRIIAKGYGESNPIVVCEPEDNCTEEDHEWNRRCELVIVKWE